MNKLQWNCANLQFTVEPVETDPRVLSLVLRERCCSWMWPDLNRSLICRMFYVFDFIYDHLDPRLNYGIAVYMLDTFCSGMLLFSVRLTFRLKCSILQTLFKGKQISQIIFKIKHGLQGVEKLVTLYAINSGPIHMSGGSASLRSCCTCFIRTKTTAEPSATECATFIQNDQLGRYEWVNGATPERAHRWNWTDGRGWLHPHRWDRRQLDTCSFNRSPHIWSMSVKRPGIRNTDAHVPGRMTGELAPMWVHS